MKANHIHLKKIINNTASMATIITLFLLLTSFIKPIDNGNCQYYIEWTFFKRAWVGGESFSIPVVSNIVRVPSNTNTWINRGPYWMRDVEFGRIKDKRDELIDLRNSEITRFKSYMAKKHPLEDDRVTDNFYIKDTCY